MFGLICVIENQIEKGPEHQLLYGKIFKVGEGDKNGNMPCERYGCKCGIEWLTSDEVEKLKKRKV